MDSVRNVIGIAIAVFLVLLAIMYLTGYSKSNFEVPYSIQNYISHYVTDQRKAHIEL